MDLFDIDIINWYMKQYGFRPAILKENIKTIDTEYLKETLFLIKCHKEYDDDGEESYYENTGWTGQFEFVLLFKCGENDTPSGYKTFKKYNVDFEYIKR